MSKTLILRRSISQRNKEEAIVWNLSHNFEGLGIAGTGSIANTLQKIIEAHAAGYEILMPVNVESGQMSVSLEVRKAVMRALGQ
jgi:hypothetical protein